MFEIVDSSSVPGLRSVAPLQRLPIKELPIGKAIRVPLDESMSQAQIRKLHGLLRVRAHRAQSSTGNTYGTHRAEDAIYITRVA